MSDRLKQWAMSTPEFQRHERQVETGPYDGPRGSIASLESQVPRSQQLRQEVERERNRD